MPQRPILGARAILSHLLLVAAFSFLAIIFTVSSIEHAYERKGYIDINAVMTVVRWFPQPLFDMYVQNTQSKWHAALSSAAFASAKRTPSTWSRTASQAQKSYYIIFPPAAVRERSPEDETALYVDQIGLFALAISFGLFALLHAYTVSRMLLRRLRISDALESTGAVPVLVVAIGAAGGTYLSLS